MTTQQNHDDAFSMNKINSCGPWSDLQDDVLLLVMMQLGLIDFLAFRGVCKSWRSLALNNRNNFMTSRMLMCEFISSGVDDKKCYLEDFEGRMLKTILPNSSDKICIGVTCGYLVLFEKKTRDFWLVNHITRHELHFPNAYFPFPTYLGAILVFSPSISTWTFAVFSRYHDVIWLSINGIGGWTKVSIPFCIVDLIAFKGKIYALHSENILSEVRLFPKPKVTLLEIKNFSKPGFRYPVFVNFGENLYVMDRSTKYPYKIQEINFSKMEWVSCEKIREEYAFFLSKLKHGIVIILHDCVSVNLLHE